MKRDWDRMLLRENVASGSLCGLFAPSEFVDGGTFITQRGHLATVAKVQPMPWESRTVEELEELTTSFMDLLNFFDSDMRVYQYQVKTRRPELALSAGEVPAVERRRLFLESRRGEMYAIRNYITAVCESRKGVSLMPQSQSRIDKELTVDARRVRGSLNSFLAGMSEFVSGSILDKDRTFAFLRELVNYGPLDGRKTLAHDHDIAWQMADSSVSLSPVMRVGHDYVRVWTLSELTKKTTVHLLRALAQIPCSSIVVTEFKPKEIRKQQEEVRSKINKLTWTKKGSQTVLSTQPVAESDQVIDRGLAKDQDMLGQVEEVMIDGAVWFGLFSLVVTIHDPDPERFAAAADKVEECMLLKGGSMMEQTGKAALAAWLAMVPGNTKYRFFPIEISNENYADAALCLFGPPVGEERNDHLEAECLTVLETRFGTPYHLNFHRALTGGRAELGHTCRTGVQRSGKSFSFGLWIEQYQKYCPYTIIYDVTSGYRLLTEHFGGSYFRLGQQQGAATINPWMSLEESPDNITFIKSLLLEMIESDKSGPLDSIDQDILYVQIGELYQLSESRRHLHNLAVPRRISDRLARWRRGGQYAYLMDNVEDTLRFAEWTALEFPNLREEADALNVMLHYASARTDQQVKQRSPQPGLIVVDEMPSFLQRQRVKDDFVRWVKEWPKLNAMMLFAFHSFYDLNDPAVRGLIESCATKIHGYNPSIDEKVWQEGFGMTAAETAAVKRLKSKLEMLVQGDGIVQLRVDEVSALRFSNSSHTAADRVAFVAEHGEAALVGR